jgi:predicted metalloprotease with PDZ domain
MQWLALVRQCTFVAMKQICSICLTLCLLLCSVFFVRAGNPVKYTLRFPEPHTHYVEVEMELDMLNGKTVDLSMPVWAPGSYLVREFPRHVERFRAFGASSVPLRHLKVSKDTWRVELEGQHRIRIRYAVYANELSVRTSYIDDEHAYLNGTSVFLYAKGGLKRPCTVKVEPYASWKRMSVALDPTAKNDSWTVQADNYDCLVDAPFEIGNHSIFHFQAAGVPHEVAMFGIDEYDSLRLQKDMMRVAETCTRIFGTHPCKRYVFIVHHLPSGGGGLEHENSTTLQTSRTTYSAENAYTGFMSLVAHEYFHLWNVKRLRPLPLGPFDYAAENYTDLLWFSEGFTAYYDDLIAWRCGFYSDEEYFKTLASGLSYCRNIRGGSVQTLSESSTEAWVKFYRPHENSSNTSVSYYTKGAAVAFLLDMQIRERTAGRKSLDDVMQAMYERYFKSLNKGFTRADLDQMCTQTAGVDLSTFLSGLVDSLSFPDPADALSVVGLSLKDLNQGSMVAWSGITTNAKDGKLTVSAIERGSPAWDAGINVNDELIAVDEFRLSDDLTKVISSYKSGEAVEIILSRAGTIRRIKMNLRSNPNVKYQINRISGSTKADHSDTGTLLSVDAKFRAWSGK